MKIFRKSINERPEARAILKGGGRVMNRARANDYQEAVILASQNGFRAHSGIVDEIGSLLGSREIVGQDCRRDQRVNTPDTQIICSFRRHGRNVVALLLGCKGISIPGNPGSSVGKRFWFGKPCFRIYPVFMKNRVSPAKAPPNRDFTGGMIPPSSCSYVGSTGNKSLDKEILELAERISAGGNHCLLAEMMITGVRIACGGAVTGGDFKLMNRALKEMREASEVFHPYQDRRKVSVFGSARTKPEEPAYRTAVEFSRRMKEEGFMTITGAGPGIMAAGNEGAGKEESFGLNIALPFEASANEFIEGDEKLINFNYFFTRKLSFVKEADAAIGLPGGFGTMDEVFEALTLIQTGKASIYPIVLLDAPGGTYWKFWKQFVDEHLGRLGMISENDHHLFRVTDDVEEAVQEVVQFYRNFHSYRYVGDKIVLRLNAPLSDGALLEIQKNFTDLVKEGQILQRNALEEEGDEADLLSLTRLVFHHRRRDFGRLRQLIDAVNSSKIVGED